MGYKYTFLHTAGAFLMVRHVSVMEEDSEGSAVDENTPPPS